MNSRPHSTRYFLHDGELTASEEAAINLNDRAIVQGHGLFETIAAYEGRPFALDEHVERLRRAADRIGLDVPRFPEIEASLHRVLEANHLNTEAKARLRITITGGTTKSEVFYEASLPPQHSNEAKTVTVPYARNEKGALVGMKTLSYGENVPAAQYARKHHADEGIWANTVGQLCEGTWSNVFVWINGNWMTPPLSSGCLPGVTRSRVLLLAKESNIEIQEENLAIERLKEVEAGFLTSSLREIQPISSIDGRQISEVTPEELAVLQRAYRKATQAN